MQSRRYGTGSRTMLAWCLLLLACCSPTCAADKVLTDEEWTILNQSLTTSDEALAKAQERLEKSDEKLAKAEQRLLTAEQKLEKAESKSAKLEQRSQEQEQEIKLLSKSCKKQKREAAVGKVKAWCIGFAIGAAGGIIGGYCLAR